MTPFIHVCSQDMTRNFTKPVIKRLFALSGNICAFPNCEVLMVADDIIVGEICHIEGENPTSSRYNQDMTDKERGSFDNLIIFCPTHHTVVDKDPSKYAIQFLKELKTKHERKYRDNPFNIPDHVLEIVNVSVNYDEYSLERIHNLLKIFKKLEGAETKKEWFEYIKYAFKGLTIRSPISDDKKEALLIVFNDINDLKTNVTIFQELILIFLERIPTEIRQPYIEKIRPYIEDMKEHDFTNINFPRFYKYLDKSEVESLEYLIEKAGDLNKDQFDILLTSMNISDRLKTLAQNQKIFMNFERRLWETLDSAEKEKERYNNLFENTKTLLNKFILTTS